MSHFQALEEDIAGHHTQLLSVNKGGEDLIESKHFGSGKIRMRIQEILGMWENLDHLAYARKKRLQEALNMYQVCRLGIAVLL